MMFLNENSGIDTKKLVLFGAGKIGRSFIGQLFSRGGYEVVFVDINKDLIEELNRKREYRVIIKSHQDEVLTIRNIRGINAEHQASVVKEVSTAGIIAVSVGQKGLQGAVRMIASGLSERIRKYPEYPVDIIVAENMRNASEYFRQELKQFLPRGFPLDSYVGIIETSIGKMVPIMLKKDLEEDILQVFAEPYNTLILDRNAFRNPIPAIVGLAPKENMKAWVDRKLFIHNLGHAAAAYTGFLYNPDFKYLYEALSVNDIHRVVREAMMQAAESLIKKYPEEFSVAMLTEHIDDLLCRFQSKALGDTIFRVGCDLSRKLGPDDRLAGAIRLARDFNQPYDKILLALVCASGFKATDEHGYMLPSDVEFFKYVESKKGDMLKNIIKNVCKFDIGLDRDVFRKAAEIEKNILARGIKNLISK
jgi:mannitol-1-phosphate 5-dehydrogenase